MNFICFSQCFHDWEWRKGVHSYLTNEEEGTEKFPTEGQVLLEAAPSRTTAPTYHEIYFHTTQSHSWSSFFVPQSWDSWLIFFISSFPFSILYVQTGYIMLDILVLHSATAKKSSWTQGCKEKKLLKSVPVSRLPFWSRFSWSRFMLLPHLLYAPLLSH